MKFNLEYTDGQLTGLVDADSNGYAFSRTHWSNSSPMKMSMVKYIYGNGADSGSYYSYDRVNFSADTTTSKVTYYDVGNNQCGTRNVSRRFAKGIQASGMKTVKEKFLSRQAMRFYRRIADKHS